EDRRAKIEYGKCEELSSGDTVCILALGSMVEKAGMAMEMLVQKGLHPTLVNARFAKPLDTTYLCRAKDRYKAFITIEDGVLRGGFGEQVLKSLYTMGYRGQVKNLGFPDEFIGQGDCGQIYEKYGLSADAIARTVEAEYGK
ncbi:MAG: transketolase C-terminal domain-containing protein, partial [Lachnospiraceae bacterium]|nr:transketolase C-terminal domain-containing protein [Lachnospiraceae bacterium]